MQRSLFILFLLFQSFYGFAGHIAGGEIFYRYISPTPGNPTSSRYLITVRLFRECNPPPPQNPNARNADMPANVIVAIYNNTTPSTVVAGSISVSRTTFNELPLTQPDPCITLPPGTRICYQVGTYELTYDLPNTATGYIVSFQTCCRTYNIANVQAYSFADGGGTTTTGEGATYTCEIPGSSKNALTNSSAVFSLKDTTLVCNFSQFNLDFSATDPDADSLSYTFCGAFDRGNTVSSAFPTGGYSIPPYNNITYTAGFSGSQPLGPDVTINPVTGIISGRAPAKGRYVVNVCITEWKKGAIVRQHRKDFTLIVEDCTRVGAQLKPSYITCDGYTLAFENQSSSSNIAGYLWDFGERSIPSSTAPTPTHTYKDTGVYTLKLTVTNTAGCKDSTTSPVKIFPGFLPNFTVQSSCFLNPYQFKDATTTKYGIVNSWRWDFGDSTSIADSAHSKDSAWKYASPRMVNVRLIVTNSKGCIDTITKPVAILDKPQLNLPFRDTLICSIDTLALRVHIQNGSAVWTPEPGPNQLRITHPNSVSPLVYPTDTTRYYISVNDNGCANSDSVTVNVLQFIEVDLRDTAICLTDTVHLQPISHAVSYVWASSTRDEDVTSTKFPLVKPLVNTKYSVTANLGKCQAKDAANIVVTPYATATAGSDIIICYGSRAQLHGTSTGSQFRWSPAASLINENTLSPIAGPVRTTAYILTANTEGCPKPKSDTVIVTVISTLTPHAGNDTVIAVGQPLQLNATGGSSYIWTPSIGLNNPFIHNPIATLTGATDSIIYTVRALEADCYAEDKIIVHVFKTGVDILVPSAFTPNGDGRNDVVKPFMVGITTLTYFSVYNRWGQLLFTTNQIGKAWDGNFAGTPQSAGTYVYHVLGADYKGDAVYRKGTIVLIR